MGYDAGGRKRVTDATQGEPAASAGDRVAVSDGVA
jgi:hypothetical protein